MKRVMDLRVRVEPAACIKTAELYAIEQRENARPGAPGSCEAMTLPSDAEPNAGSDARSRVRSWATRERESRNASSSIRLLQTQRAINVAHLHRIVIERVVHGFGPRGVALKRN